MTSEMRMPIRTIRVLRRIEKTRKIPNRARFPKTLPIPTKMRKSNQFWIDRSNKSKLSRLTIRPSQDASFITTNHFWPLHPMMEPGASGLFPRERKSWPETAIATGSQTLPSTHWGLIWPLPRETARSKSGTLLRFSAPGQSRTTPSQFGRWTSIMEESSS